MSDDAILVLEDGTALRGTAYGAAGETFGEMVFNTGMTGYQETLTDPSYAGQIVAMTAPHIGNTGVNDEDPESRRVWVSGYVMREPSRLTSSWRATQGLDEYLKAQGVTAIALSATRQLTMKIREQGAMRAVVSSVEDDPGKLLEKVLASPGMKGADLARVVTTPRPYTVSPPAGTRTKFKVAAVDLGIKTATPRNMAQRGIEVHVLPAASTAEDILKESPDGVFFSNGPGDPAAASYAVNAMKGVLDASVPVFGICFGSQILSRALGLETYKLRYGHRGVNQPVMDLATGRVYITSHNHGFAAALPGQRGTGGQGGTGGRIAPSSAGGVWGGSLPPKQALSFGTPYGEAEVSHVNLNDGVVEGIRLTERPVFAVQYHPESAPGPHDAVDLFDHFCTVMDSAKNGGK